MKLMRKLLPGIVVLLLLTTTALAMSSDNYGLEWHTALMGSGGPAQSTNFAVNLTIGQSAIASASSTNYQAGMGYWYGLLPNYPMYLPIISR